MVDLVHNVPRRKRQRGATLLLFTILVALVLIPLLGLAIDGAIVFWVRAKLTAAVDAAALAAGRSINVYVTQPQNTGTAVNVAQQWFNANYPSGWLGTSIVGGGPSVTVQPTQTMTQQVNVTASAVVPLYFMRLLGKASVTIAAAAQSARRNLNMVLVLDRSGSMGPPPNGSNACPIMIQAAQNFVNMFTDGFDTLGLVTFSSTANTNPIDYAPTTHFKNNAPTLSSTIGQISCIGGTSTAQALNVAYQSVQSTGLKTALNVIVLFTDGQPNEVVEMGTTSWPLKTQPDARNNFTSPFSSTTMPASTCNNGTTLVGGLTILGHPPSTTGYTGGLYDTTTRVALNSSAGIVAANNCAFTQKNYYVRQDVAYIPTSDAYGNATNTGYKGAPDTFSNGVYTGIRDDEQIGGVVAAAFNAADNQATKIRNDSNYTIVIYTIGLDGAPDVSIDSTFLERVANDPRSPIYDSTKPAGFYAYAANPSALNQAFFEVASQVLRLSQ